ncbi:MAG: hypothetical protein ACYTEQ_08205 [Planctomycetota bacterium]|jgi:hypothetical protein
MDKEYLCQSCKQSHLCQEVYQKLGKTQGRSVVLKVVCAFLLPVVVFIVSLAVLEKIAATAITGEGLRTAVSVPAAAAVSFACVLITRVINKRIGKNEQ